MRVCACTKKKNILRRVSPQNFVGHGILKCALNVIVLNKKQWIFKNFLRAFVCKCVSVVMYEYVREMYYALCMPACMCFYFISIYTCTSLSTHLFPLSSNSSTSYNPIRRNKRVMYCIYYNSFLFFSLFLLFKFQLLFAECCYRQYVVTQKL